MSPSPSPSPHQHAESPASPRLLPVRRPPAHGCSRGPTAASHSPPPTAPAQARTPKGKAVAERRVIARYERKHAIFCSDMSGFSRVSKEEGTLHFLALVKRIQVAARLHGGAGPAAPPRSLFTSPALCLLFCGVPPSAVLMFQCAHKT